MATPAAVNPSGKSISQSVGGDETECLLMLSGYRKRSCLFVRLLLKRAEAPTGRRSLASASIPLPPLNRRSQHCYSSQLCHQFRCQNDLVVVYLYAFIPIQYRILFFSVKLAKCIHFADPLISSLCDTKGYFAYRCPTSLPFICYASLHRRHFNICCRK